MPAVADVLAGSVAVGVASAAGVAASSSAPPSSEKYARDQLEGEQSPYKRFAA